MSLATEPASAIALEEAAGTAEKLLQTAIGLHTEMESRLLARDAGLEICEVAISLERETLVFYKALMDFVKHPPAQKRIRGVFEKEREHFGNFRSIHSKRNPSRPLQSKVLFQGLTGV